MYGYIVVITRNGSLGGRYPLVTSECLFGQSPNCDVKVYVANVARRHCLITASPNGKAYIRNLSASNTTLVNSIPIGAELWQLEHADVITVGDRHFRWEYPPSACPPATPRQVEKADSPACMVQVPLSVFKNKRHSSTGLVKEKISINPQEDEPNPKRRKTIHNITDLGVENQLSKPVNKRLQALTQPASSPKSLNTFRVLSKSASKGKTLTPVSKTPKLKKASPAKRSPTRSPLKPKTPLSKLNSPKKRKSEIATPSKIKKTSPDRCLKTVEATISPKSKSKIKQSPETPDSTTTQLKLCNSEINKGNVKLSRKTLTPKNKSVKAKVKPRGSLPASFKILAKGSKTSKVIKTPKMRKILTPKKRTPKTPQAVKPPRKSSAKLSVSTPKVPRGRSKTPKKSSSKVSLSPSNTPRERSNSPNKVISTGKSSPGKSGSSSKTPRGRSPKTPQATVVTSRKSSPEKLVSPSKTHRGRSPKTPQSVIASRESSPVKTVSTSKTPRGRSKTPKKVISTGRSSPRKSVSPLHSPRGRSPKTPQSVVASRESSPKKSVSPSKTPRGRPFKTPQAIEGTSRKSSPEKSVSPSKTPRGRSPKTPQSEIASRESSPEKSVSPSKTPRGRSAKTPQSVIASRESSPDKSVSPSKTPRGRPPKTPQAIVVTSRKSSPEKLVSPSKTPRGRSPKTPQSVIASRESSPEKSVSPSKTPRGRPSKTPQAIEGTPRKSSPEKSVSPSKTPRGRSLKTPQSVIASRESSPDKSPSKTPRGRPPKTPQAIVVTSRQSSPEKLVSLSKTPRERTPKTPQSVIASRESSPEKSVSPPKTPRERPPQTPQATVVTSRKSSPEKLVSPSKTPRGRSPKTPQSVIASRESSPGKSVSTSKTPRGRSKTPKKVISTRRSSPRKSVSPLNTPSQRSPKPPQAGIASRESSPDKSVSPSKTPRGRPQAVVVAKSLPEKSVSTSKTPKGRSPKTPKEGITSRESSPDKSGSPSKTLRGMTSKTPQAVAVAPRGSSPQKSDSTSKTPRGRSLGSIEDISDSMFYAGGLSPRKSVSPLKTPQQEKLSSRSTSPLKTVSPSKTLKTPSEKLPTTPKQAESLFNDSNVTRSLRSFSKSEPELFVFSATPKPKHNRASILRTSLHHDLSTFNNIETSLFEERRKTPLVASTSKNLVLSAKNRRSSIRPVSENHKRKFSDDIEAKAELAAKKLKMETPKSLSKNKMAAILVCHGRSPNRVTSRPLLFSDVLKHRLSEAKRKPSKPLLMTRPATKKTAKTKSFKPSLEVPKTFNFSSTGHANSPETIVIRKKVSKTPVLKFQRGRKSKSTILPMPAGSKEQDLDGVPELFKTPAKAKVSSLKSATSVKKDPNVRVRFSLHNNVQSPSGRSSLVLHVDETPLPGSPTVSSKKYVRTPRFSRGSTSGRGSLLQSSIIEESPLAQEMESPKGTKASASFTESPKRLSGQSNDFSIYSPSSPTLNLSKISSASPLIARKSINFDSILDFGEGDDSPNSSPSRGNSKAKRRSSESQMLELSHSSRVSTQDVNQSADLFATSASSSISRSLKRTRSLVSVEDSFKQSPSKEDNSINTSKSTRKISLGQRFQPSPDQNAQLSTSDLYNSSRITRTSQRSPFGSPNTPSNSLLSSMNITDHSSKSSRINVSQIPLPPSGSRSRLSTEQKSRLSDSNSSTSARLSKSRNSTQDSSKTEMLHLSESDISPSTSGHSEGTVQVGTKRVSSTPKPLNASLEKSPVSSPILTGDKQSKSSSISYIKDESKTIYDTPSTSGKRHKYGSARMSASNSNLPTSEGQLPVAAVKPSTRKKQGNESLTSLSQSVSLPNLSNSHEVSGRSLDRSLSRKIIDSRFSDSLTQIASHQMTQQSSFMDQNSSAGSGRRKRKSSASTSALSIGNSSFDFSSVVTPRVPREVFISPLEEPQERLSGVKRIFNPAANSPVSSYVNVRGVKRLLKTPKMSPNHISVEGIKSLFNQTPTANYSNVEGLKRLYNLTPEANYMNIKGVRRIFTEPKGFDSPDVAGLEVLFESPKKVVDDFSEPSTSKPVGKVTPMSRAESDKEIATGSQGDPVEITNSRTRRTRRTIGIQNIESIPEQNTRRGRKVEVPNSPQVHEQHVQNKVLQNSDHRPLEKNARKGRKAAVSNEEQEKELVFPLSVEKNTRKGKTNVLENESQSQGQNIVLQDVASPSEEKPRRGRKPKLQNESNIEELSVKNKSRLRGKQTQILNIEVEESSERVSRISPKKTRGGKKIVSVSEQKLVTQSKTQEESVGVEAKKRANKRKLTTENTTEEEPIAVETKKRTRANLETVLVEEETSSSTRGSRRKGQIEKLVVSTEKKKNSGGTQNEKLNSDVKKVRNVKAKLDKTEQNKKLSSQDSINNVKEGEMSKEETKTRSRKLRTADNSIETKEKEVQKLGKRSSNSSIAVINKTASSPKKARKGRKEPEKTNIHQLPKRNQQDEPSLDNAEANIAAKTTRSKKIVLKESPAAKGETAPSKNIQSPKTSNTKNIDRNKKSMKGDKMHVLTEEICQVETVKVGRGSKTVKETKATAEVKPTRSRGNKLEAQTSTEEVQPRSTRTKKGQNKSTPTKSKDKVIEKKGKNTANNTEKLEERLKEDAALVQNLENVNKSKKSKEEMATKGRPTRRVQFNTSLKTSRKSDTNKQTTLKTKASTKLKASSKRQSTSPKKSPPAKRTTRSRK